MGSSVSLEKRLLRHYNHKHMQDTSLILPPNGLRSFVRVTLILLKEEYSGCLEPVRWRIMAEMIPRDLKYPQGCPVRCQVRAHLSYTITVDFGPRLFTMGTKYSHTNLEVVSYSECIIGINIFISWLNPHTRSQLSGIRFIMVGTVSIPDQDCKSKATLLPG